MHDTSENLRNIIHHAIFQGRGSRPKAFTLSLFLHRDLPAFRNRPRVSFQQLQGSDGFVHVQTFISLSSISRQGLSAAQASFASNAGPTSFQPPKPKGDLFRSIFQIRHREASPNLIKKEQQSSANFLVDFPAGEPEERHYHSHTRVVRFLADTLAPKTPVFMRSYAIFLNCRSMVACTASLL